MEIESNVYAVTWETWHTMTGNLKKMEEQRDEAMRLIEQLIEAVEAPENLDKFVVWKKCYNQYEELKAEKEKHL
jgi:hypothetical protein